MKHLENLSSVPFDAIKRQAIFSDVYSFFDVAFAVKSDREEMLEWFRYVYPRFRLKKAGEKVDVAYYMMTGTPEGPLVITEQNSHLKIKLSDDIYSVPFYTHLLASNYITANLKSHFLLHGAVVSRNDEGLAIVGPSGSGKTTLMLKLLLEKGFRFLSDERLAISRKTRLVDPYPRSIGIRENTLSLLDNPELEQLKLQAAGDGQRKWFVDISEISRNELGTSCCLKYIVFLDYSSDGEDGQPVELAVDELNDQLLEKLRSVARGGETHCRRTGDHYALSFYADEETYSAMEFERLCQDCNILLLGMRKLGSIEPDFHLMPEIQRIFWHTAAMELLKGLEKGLRDDFHSNPGRAFLELAELLEDVECYKLSIGKLDEMAEHVCNMALSSENN